MPFLELVYQAEVNRFEDQEFEELARKNCSEDPNTRASLIAELRSLIKDRRECTPRRLDDAYLLRFLRCRRFKPRLAYKLMVRYEEFRRKNAHLYDCEPFTLHWLKDLYTGVVPENPVNGRVIIVSSKGWHPDTVTTTDIARVALLMNEITLQQPKMQILGFTVIFDVGYVGLRHLRHINTSFAYQTVGVLGVSFPIMIHSLHVVNYSTILSPFIYIFKQFIPSYMWNRIFFHGTNMKSLHKHIDPESLPPEYGGHCRETATFEEWITKIDIYKDDFLVNELRDLGYTVTTKNESKRENKRKPNILPQITCM